MATMSVISWANLLQDSLLFIHKKNGLNSISSWRRCLDRGVFTLFACFLLGHSANAQNFLAMRCTLVIDLRRLHFPKNLILSVRKRSLLVTESVENYISQQLHVW